MAMRKWARTACALALSAGMAGPAWAEVEASPRFDGMLRKLGRGVANVATCPAELFRTTEQTLHREGYIAAMTVGILQGALRTILRGSVGVFEIATFYAEIPPGYKPLIMPEFAFGDGDVGAAR